MAGSASPPPFAIRSGSSLRDAVRVIEQAKKTIAVVVNQDLGVVGTVSDGDVRRALLAGFGLDSDVAHAMNSHPLVMAQGTEPPVLIELLKSRNLEAVPLVDHGGKLVDVFHIDEFETSAAQGGGEGFFAAVIMAGGEGQRLRPLTKDVPKPMLDMGGVPLIERQVKRMARAGIGQVYISVNYLGDVIERHLGDGSHLGTRVSYLRENSKLGTAGALALIDAQPDAPLLVINGDVLTSTEFNRLLSFHLQHHAAITVGAVAYNVQIPYGVITTNGMKAVRLEEKPSQSFLCNAGMYVISPELLPLIPRDTSYNMTDLLGRCIEEGREVIVFPIHEYWTDIGTPADLERARNLIGSLDRAGSV